jgi:plastocyanin
MDNARYSNDPAGDVAPYTRCHTARDWHRGGSTGEAANRSQRRNRNMRQLHLSGRSVLTGSLLLTALALMAFGISGRQAIAQDTAGDSHPAHLHTGTCEAPGDVIYPLSNVSSEFLVDGAAMAGSGPVGAASAIPVESSQTTVPAALADIAAGGHTLVVHESDAAIQNYIACGDVGGAMMGTSDLAFGIGQLNDSGYSGVAWLRDNGDGSTLVTIFLTGETATAMSGMAGHEMPATAAVAIEGFAYIPPTIEIAAGDTVTWTNNDGAQHTVSQSGGGFQSGALAQGATFSQAFDTPGTYDYFCEFHANMSGTVIVS